MSLVRFSLKYVYSLDNYINDSIALHGTVNIATKVTIIINIAVNVTINLKNC